MQTTTLPVRRAQRNLARSPRRGLRRMARASARQSGTSVG